MGDLKFNLKSVQPKDDTVYKARIEPGVHEVVIVGITDDVNANGKAYIEVTFENIEGTRTHTERMFCSTEAGIEWTTRRLKEIFVAIYGKGKEPDNLVISQLQKAFTGKKLRCMFLGEQIQSYKTQDLIWITKLRLSNFAESMEVAASESRFVFDPSKHMIKYKDPKLAKPESVIETIDAQINDELVF